MKYVSRLFTEFELEYVRSRGPGGQHVNKTNSACLLRWSVISTQMFSFDEKEVLLKKLARQMTVDGDLILRSDEFRDQEANRKRCLEKLDEIIARAFFVQKARKATKPTWSSQVKRKDGKRHRGDIKSGRGKVKKDEWD